IFIAFLLIFSVSSTVWGQYALEKDNIEISSEKEADGEKDAEEKETEGWDDLVLSSSSHTHSIFSGFVKVGSSTLEPANPKKEKLYVLFHRLKIHC
ncbi:MAG: hypothetical protein AB8B73_11945, partial [Ekhidna sp.]